jgi:hypothetical protein
MRYKFIKLPDIDPLTHDDSEITHEFEATTVDQMVEAFEDFLAGCGFARYKFDFLAEAEE